MGFAFLRREPGGLFTHLHAINPTFSLLPEPGRILQMRGDVPIMKRKHHIATGLISAAILFSANGCAFLTAKTVGTAVATHVGKKVIKDAKEEHDQKKAEEEQQRQVNAGQPSQP